MWQLCDPRRHGFNFCLDAKKVRQAPVYSAPVVKDDVVAGEDANADVETPALVARRSQARSLDAARPPDPPGIRHWSPVEVMRNELRVLHTLVCGTKEQLWKCVLESEEMAARKAALQRESAAELEARRQGLSEQ